jgi:hypothetical protein
MWTGFLAGRASRIQPAWNRRAARLAVLTLAIVAVWVLVFST